MPCTFSSFLNSGPGHVALMRMPINEVYPWNKQSKNGRTQLIPKLRVMSLSGYQYTALNIINSNYLPNSCHSLYQCCPSTACPSLVSPWTPSVVTLWCSMPAPTWVTATTTTPTTGHVQSPGPCSVSSSRSFWDNAVVCRAAVTSPGTRQQWTSHSAGLSTISAWG